MEPPAEPPELLAKFRALEIREAHQRRCLADILAFSTRLTKTGDLVSLYRESNSLARNILKLDYATLMVLSDDGNSLVIRDTIGFPAEMIGTFALLEGQGLSTYVAKAMVAAAVEDFHAEQRFEVPPVVFVEGIVSALAVPMLLGERLFGVMIGHTREKRRFAPEEIDLFQSLANQAAVAIQNVLHFESLQDSEQRFRTLVDYAADAIFLSDQTGRLVDVNAQACQSLGYSREELLAMEVTDVDPCARIEDHRGKLWPTMAPNQPVTVLSQHRRKDGSLFPVEVRAVLISRHETSFILGFARDISERRQAEEERQRLQEQLIQSQKLEAVGRLAGGVAHDFNNMLSVILGYTDILLAESPVEDAAHAKITEIKLAAQRSADLTRQLLAFARRQTVSPQVIDLNRTVAGMHRMLGRLIGENIELTWSPGPAPWTLKMDPSQVDQILANLCVNASDAIGGVGRIRIETGNVVIDQAYADLHQEALPGEYVKLMVSDNGCGIEPGDLPLVFEPFFTTKRQGKGTGLGLATVYGIVRQNRGFVKVCSEPGVGTTFTIYLPRFGAEGGASEGRALPGELHPGSETILVVEDEPSVLLLTCRLLEKLGYTVLAAATPGEALKQAQAQGGAIDLLITDVIMPEMNGRELAARLLPACPGGKCLYVSGYTANVIGSQLSAMDGVGFLQKPFSIKELGDKVREVLESPALPR